MNKQKYSKEINFSNHKLGLYSIDTFTKDWNTAQTKRGKPPKGILEGRSKIVRVGNDKVLQLTIPKNTVSDGGFFWRLKFPKSLEDATFEYDIRFGKNFDFVRGGKLPGLGGGTAPGGGSKDQNGFSARLMWREIDFKKSGLLKKPVDEEFNILKKIIDSGVEKEKIFDQINKIKNEIIKFEWHCRDLVKEPHKAFLVQYVYYPGKDGRYGENLAYRYGNNRDKKVFVKPDKWYNIKMRIKLSENSKQEDRIIAWVDGVKVLDKKRYLRKKKSYGIDQMMFSLFFGGSDETWHTTKDEKVYFRKFFVKGN